MKPYVYRLTHKTTGQFYIGYRESNKADAELDLPKYQSSSKIVKELGFENFDWEIVAKFEQGEEAYIFENMLIKEYINNPLCLNGHYVENGNNFFRRTGSHSEETKAAISAGNKGKTRSEEARAKVAEANRGRTASEETKAKMSESQTGRKHTEESKAKMSEARRGETRPPLTEEHKAKIRSYRHTDEAKERIREKMRKPKSPETIERMKAAQRARRLKEIQ